MNPSHHSGAQAGHTRSHDASHNERLDYFGLDAIRPSDGRRIGSEIGRALDRGLSKFYRKIAEMPGLGHFFSDQNHMNKARDAQRKHWIDAFSKGLDTEYFQRANRIGQTHARIGLEPKWYVGGYALILEELVKSMAAPGLTSLLPWRRARARRMGLLVKVALLDMEIALSTYFDANEAQIRAVIDQFGSSLSLLAKGNLTTRVHGLPREYARLETDFNDAMDSLSHAFGEIVSSIGIIDNGSEEITAGTDDLARRTEQQAAALEQTSAAMQQVTELVRQTAEGTRLANVAVHDAHKQADEGSTVVSSAVTAMGAIEKTSKQVAEIVTLIDAIAFQTNLLALNAGVEAARAGDSGKGFAVVASEVRGLAQRTAEAAKDIKSLIATSEREVIQGVDLVSRTGAMLTEIQTKIAVLTNQLGAISQSSDSQAQSIDEVRIAVSQMDSMTQKNAALVEQTNAATRSLTDQAAALSRLSSKFETANDHSVTRSERYAVG